MRNPRHDSASSAIATGIRDLFGKRESIGELTDADRIDGRICLVTGASSGLGKATAVELARRGGRVIMACRSKIPEAGEDVKRLSGSTEVEMVHVDLTDFDSIFRLVEELEQKKVLLDRVVMNAGVVPKEARKTKQGFEEMFAVNYLANFLLTTELLRRGVIPNKSFTRKAGETETGIKAGTRTSRSAPAGSDKTEQAGQKPAPRIVFVSSETHRTAGKIDFESFAAFTPYTMRESVARYGYTKLLLETFVAELTRRLSGGTGDVAHNLPSSEGVEVAVHSLCPGPVNTNIAREAPAVVQPPMKLLFSIFFKSPSRACKPVVYLTCADALEGKTGIYLHLMTPKSAGKEALDPENGAILWRKTEELIGV